MEAHAHHHGHEHHAGHDHDLPASGRALDALALSATLHCLTGCAIGEVLGMVIGTAAGFSEVGTIALAVALAFFFGYLLTSLPLLRSGLALAAVVPIALASDTASIAVMEIVDNAIMVAVPGAMEAGAGNVLFWGSLSVALVVAGAFAFPLNRWLIRRGKGHAVVHQSGVHHTVPVRLIGAIAVVAFVFGSVVLLAEALGDDEGGGGGGHAAAAALEVMSARSQSALRVEVRAGRPSDAGAPGSASSPAGASTPSDADASSTSSSFSDPCAGLPRSVCAGNSVRPKASILLSESF